MKTGSSEHGASGGSVDHAHQKDVDHSILGGEGPSPVGLAQKAITEHFSRSPLSQAPTPVAQTLGC